MENSNKSFKINPPPGWYRGKLFKSDFRMTKKGSKGMRLEWDLKNENDEKYRAYQTFPTDNLWLLSEMTWGWKQVKANSLNRIEPFNNPDISHWQGDEADIIIRPLPPSQYTGVAGVFPPGSFIKCKDKESDSCDT